MSVTRPNDQAAEQPPPLSRGTKLAYGAGAIANGVKNVAFAAYLMFFYNQVVGISAAIVSAAIALTLVIDAFFDPMLGRWTDMTKSRWGRRHPFIYGAAAPTALFFAIVWFPPTGMTDGQTGLWIFVTSILTRVSISSFEIATQAMIPELTERYTERTKLFSLRYWFLYIGQYGFAAFCLLTFFKATEEFPKGQLNPDSYLGFALLGSALIFTAMIVCGLGTHNRIPWLRQRDERAARPTVLTHLKEMGAAFRNRAFLAIFAFGVLKFTAIGLYSATALYFQTYLFGFDASQLALLTIDSVVAATIAAPLAPRMSAKLGKRTSAMLFAVVGIVVGLLPLILSYFDLFFVAGDAELLPVMFVIGAVYGAMIAISLINTSSMLADVVEDSAVRTHRHDAGIFFAASSFMQQCSTALGIMANGIILTWAAFPAKVGPDDVTEPMIDSLIAHYVPTSLGLWVVGCAFLFFYPITQARHERNLAILDARRAEAKAREADNNPTGAPMR
ncbi:MFS transporter [Pacificimonas flava]|uniref:MFS transporter n=2 Tax=Pacificimonas TaxID=1960290 RepID=A0A219B7Y0_9SPHN|nr:MFS transporter [Pacificimonas aurantium]OWV34371.1 MFS transporter [Pacificimonas flava]